MTTDERILEFIRYSPGFIAVPGKGKFAHYFGGDQWKIEGGPLDWPPATQSFAQESDAPLKDELARQFDIVLEQAGVEDKERKGYTAIFKSLVLDEPGDLTVTGKSYRFRNRAANGDAKNGSVEPEGESKPAISPAGSSMPSGSTKRSKNKPKAYTGGDAAACQS